MNTKRHFVGCTPCTNIGALKRISLRHMNMSLGIFELIISFIIILKQSTFVTAESSTEVPLQSLNDILNKAVHSIVYKSMAVLISSQLYEENDKNENYSETEHPLGDQIGRILQMISVVMIVGVAVSFLLIPLIAACVLHCCGFTRSGVRSDSYAALRHSRIGNVENGTPFSEMQSMGTCKTCGQNYCRIVLLLGIPAGIIFGTIAGVNTWPYL